ncbi:hypothetical protein [Fictibacillus gelatini]|uniref:hypothetical protein n=1 Tax=Fictibacillus gelatini TaxID=225985 RepID=UPI0004792401|nr:hypothetical protein [Fictibacillus gelatini]
MMKLAVSSILAFLVTFSATPNTQVPVEKTEKVSMVPVATKDVATKENVKPKPNVELLAREFIKKLNPKSNSHYKVLGVSSKKELINQLQKVASRSVAKKYVDLLFEEKNDGLYVIPTDLPPWFNPEENYHLKKTSNTSYHLIQHNSNELDGIYTIKMDFLWNNGRWIISSVSIK